MDTSVKFESKSWTWLLMMSLCFWPIFKHCYIEVMFIQHIALDLAIREQLWTRIHIAVVFTDYAYALLLFELNNS